MDEKEARNIGIALAFVGYYYIGESIGILGSVVAAMEENGKAYKETHEI